MMQVLLGLLVVLFAVASANGPGPRAFLDYEPNVDRYDLSGESVLYNIPMKRSCIARGASCDHRAGDCCESLSCRCNLWGANCRCQRRGIF